MAYVESFYLDANLEQETHVQPVVETTENIAEQAENYTPQDEFEAFVLADRPLNFETIHQIVEMQEKVERAKRVDIQVYSDYCGFENDSLPPIYREQLRQLNKKKLEEKNQISMMTMNTAINSVVEKIDIDQENPNECGLSSSVVDNRVYFAPPKSAAAELAQKSGGSKYAWEEQTQPKSLVNTSLYTEHYETIDCVSLHDYVPGFSPPQQNETVQKRMDFTLPQGTAVNATENVYHRTNESRWVKGASPMKMKRQTSQPDSHTGTLPTSSMASSSAETSSVHTATQGPPYGAFGFVHDKHRGMGAFKPVGETVESQYAYPGLN